jgi:hypothetical protein
VIVHLTTPGNSQTLTAFSEGPAADRGMDVRTMTYRKLVSLDLAECPRATWICSDVDILPPVTTFGIARRWRELRDRGDRLLNHPTRSMGRFELLRTLHEAGINDFDVQRFTDLRAPRRYPVFVRWINAHSGPVSRLLVDRLEFDRFRERALAEDFPRDALMVCEFCETREPNGLVREFGAYRIGDTILPEHLWYSTQWMVKQRTAWDIAALDLDKQALYREEWRYLEENPHSEALMRIFDLARIEYGRIDYSMKDGQIQVWEINTNPLMTIEWTQAPGRVSEALRDWFIPRFTAAMAALDVDQGVAAR